MRNDEPDIKLRILQSAKKLFAMQGFEGTTVRQICEDAGANIAMVSYHFGGKEKVFNALFENFISKERRERVEAVKQDPVAALKVLIEEVTTFRMAEPELIRILRQEMMIDSPRSEVIRTNMFPTWELLKRLLEDGRGRGLFRFNSGDLALMSVLGVLLFGTKHSEFKSLMTEGPHSKEAIIEHATDFILGGLNYRGQ